MTAIASEYQRYQKSKLMKEFAEAAHEENYIGQTSSARYCEIKKRLQKLHLQNGSRLLDAGCGNGSFSKVIAKDFPFEVIGIDLSEELVNEASISQTSSCEFLTDDFTIMQGFTKETIDIILCVGSLYWGQSLSQTFSRWHEIATKKSHLFIFTNLLYSSLTPIEKEALAATKFIPATQFLQELTDSGWVIAEWQDSTDEYIKWLNRWCIAMNKSKKILEKEMGEEEALQLLKRFTTYKNLAETRTVRRIIIDAEHN